ncbi:glucose dehydrogenase [FAD, quinone] [Agrilus planipennis]|uniref:Glucose dehydrogenase [FAD, quinone] n=1 Tax=Agrilus planipennis TaxID=224129 RepID=A0A1W4XEG1_AGRPL|nr:glucose dehydrogenase [FAD, quinone] [Agrilus planipennis]
MRALQRIVIFFFFTPLYAQSLFGSLLNYILEGEEQDTAEPPDVRNILPEYDFIVVGSGTAGCVVANRLSENPDWKVLLIEAGRSENYIMDLPLLANYLQFTDSNWKYKTAPSGNYCMGMENHQCNWPRGKVIGGSSVLNYMIYTRGNYRDYDNWANLGNTGWSFKDVLPYFKKVEDFTIPEFNDTKYHSSGGYLTVGFAPYRTKIAEAVLQAEIQNGAKFVDYNGATQIGTSYLQVSMKNGTRASASRAYLHPIKNRRNFHVKKIAMVTKVLIDPKSMRAYGVEFVRNGVKQIVRARKEVILSAGAINSPQLLMLSGIGPKRHLKQLGIPVLKNLKVGYNLMDHIAVGGLTFMIDKPYSITTNKLIERDTLMKYFYYHDGPLSLPGGCEVLSFHDTKDPTNPDGYPDIELLYQAGSLVSDPLLRRDFGIDENIYNEVYKPIVGSESFMVFPMLLRPKSKGRIILKDKNYLSKPLIFPNYFAEREDMDTIVEGVKLILNVTKQPALQAMGTRVHAKPIPKCEKMGFGTDAYWECMARHFTFTIYHQSGTCKMGPKNDKSAVVDPRLRVYGVKGLRVIDASIIPVIPAAHTNAPTFMIAEKGADMIKEDWKNK